MDQMVKTTSAQQPKNDQHGCFQFFPKVVLEILTNGMEVNQVWFGLTGLFC